MVVFRGLDELLVWPEVPVARHSTARLALTRSLQDTPEAQLNYLKAYKFNAPWQRFLVFFFNPVLMIGSPLICDVPQLLTYTVPLYTIMYLHIQ